MAKNDWAIVVGIRNYFDPDLRGLDGPENDARSFFDWVVSRDGGGVPRDQASLILSTASETVEEAMPTAVAVREAFEHLRAIADENELNGIGREVGDRLYIFFAGHGFAPSHRDDLTALLTAEATLADAKLAHVVGSEVADWFYRAKFFREILLFIDACRSIMECAQLLQLWDDERASDFYKVRRFYAYGARVAKESREWADPDGTSRGVFTRTLIEALGGAAYDPANPSVITAESLRDHLYNAFESHMSEGDRARPDLPKEPEVVYEQKPGSSFEIASVPASMADRLLRRKPRYPVEIRPGAAAAGRKARILDGHLKVVEEPTLENPTVLSLSPGMYAIEIPDLHAEEVFQVTGGSTVVDV